MSRSTLFVALFIPTCTCAQSLQITHVSNGLDATSARVRLERASSRPYGPRFEAAGMPAAPAMEYFPGLVMPGQREAFARLAPPIRVVKPAFRLPEQDLGIADVYDVVFFADVRAVHFRVHLKASGDSVAKRWIGHLRSYFAFLDRDHNGELNRYEAEFAFSNPGMVQMLRTGYAYQRAADAPRTFADIDIDCDARIGFDEFAAYYAPSATRIVTAQLNSVRDAYADGITDELFKLIDSNGDNKLSRQELSAAPALMATLDLDEDECLSATELAPNVFNGRVATRPIPKAIPGQPLSMLVFTSGQVPENMASILLLHYDRKKNGALDKSENPFGDDVFKKLDRNGNGEVSVTELTAWVNLPPELEIDMTLGDKPETSSTRLREPTASPLSAGFKQTSDGMAVLTVGTQNVQLASYAPQGIYSQQGVRSLPFAFPNTAKGYVTEADISGPQNQALRVLFDTIDSNNDGKMTRTEYDAFFAVQAKFLSLPLSLVYSAQTPSLFEVLDANGDGRLSTREMGSAWTRLSALESGAKMEISRAALMPRGALRFGRSNEVFSVNPAALYTQPVAKRNSRGPTWFRRFDRNGDGEVSRTEFPGAASDFERLDVNRDGSITAEEAEASDKALRGKK